MDYITKCKTIRSLTVFAGNCKKPDSERETCKPGSKRGKIFAKRTPNAKLRNIVSITGQHTSLAPVTRVSLEGTGKVYVKEIGNNKNTGQKQRTQ